MGELCSKQVIELLDPSSRPFFGKNNTAGAGNTVTDLDREDWWAAFATFGQLLSGCDAAKEALDTYIGVHRIMKFLLPLL